MREYGPVALDLEPGNTDALAFLDSAQLVLPTPTEGETPRNPAYAKSA